MIDDRNPNFGRGFRVSSAQLGELKRRWGAAGRQLYAQAIRTGGDVLARTEAEIEALGRAKLKEMELQQAQSRTIGRAAESAIRAGAAAGRRGLKSVG